MRDWSELSILKSLMRIFEVLNTICGNDLRRRPKTGMPHGSVYRCSVLAARSLFSMFIALMIMQLVGDTFML